jgi:toxin-antitoxin system PIN domain toxin
MSVALLDVNVLIALLDPTHVHHDNAHRWLERNRKHGWASCPVTVNGCVRVLSNPAYPTASLTPAEAAGMLRSACATPNHHFWSDSVSLLDAGLFRLAMIAGDRKITDVYLLGLAVRNHGRLATFDQSISPKGIIGATPGHLALIGKA